MSHKKCYTAPKVTLKLNSYLFCGLIYSRDWFCQLFAFLKWSYQTMLTSGMLDFVKVMICLRICSCFWLNWHAVSGNKHSSCAVSNYIHFVVDCFLNVYIFLLCSGLIESELQGKKKIESHYLRRCFLDGCPVVCIFMLNWSVFDYNKGHFSITFFALMLCIDLYVVKFFITFVLFYP